MSGLEKAFFNLKVRFVNLFFYLLYNELTVLKFTTKQLNRQAVKAGKDEQSEKAKLKKASHAVFLLINNITCQVLINVI